MTFTVPDYIRSLVPYLPGKPIEETKRELKLKKVIKLASNENPLGPSPKAVRAMRDNLKDLHRYPDGSGYQLKRAISELLSVGSQNLILGNGSNEVIDFLIRTFCGAGDAIVTHKAAFVAYKISAQIHGVATLEGQIDAGLNCDLNEMLELVRRNEKVKFVFLANPNNPTGIYIKQSELKHFLAEVFKIREGSVIVALDDAYGEYVTARDYKCPVHLLPQYPNLIVLKTFSKIYGLAGARAGYGVASPELIAHLEKVRQPFNLNSLAQVAAEAALSDHGFVKRSRATNQAGMAFWEKSLKNASIPYWKSQGNFLLINARGGFGESGLETYQRCLTGGVIFRPVHNHGLPDALRITIASGPENRMAAQVLLKKIKRSSAR